MNWQHVLAIDPGQSVPLRRRIQLLFEHQREAWPALRDGEAALHELQKKTLTLNGNSIVVQANPGRRRSTMAKTDAQSVAARPCFLCPRNMPAEERGVAFEDLVVLPNPFPVLPLHCTIAAVEHRPQLIAGRIGSFLRLAAAIGPELMALYNGPRCGASAPDHFHFQAVSAGDIPLLNELAELPRDCLVQAYTSFGRNMLVFVGTDATSVETAIEQSIKALSQLDQSNDEPKFNLMAHSQPQRLTVALFPRTAHRPARFFDQGASRLAVSPAVLEMCGILVTSEPEDFHRVMAETALAIYDEVTVPIARVLEMAASIATLGNN